MDKKCNCIPPDACNFCNNTDTPSLLNKIPISKGEGEEQKKMFLDMYDEVALLREKLKEQAEELEAERNNFARDAYNYEEQLKIKAEELAKMQEALKAIMKHYEVIAGSLTPVSVVYNIAKKALK